MSQFKKILANDPGPDSVVDLTGNMTSKENTPTKRKADVRRVAFAEKENCITSIISILKV